MPYAARAWYDLASALEAMEMQDVPKFDDLLKAIRKATIVGAQDSIEADRSIGRMIERGDIQMVPQRSVIDPVKAEVFFPTLMQQEDRVSWLKNRCHLWCGFGMGFNAVAIIRWTPWKIEHHGYEAFAQGFIPKGWV